MELIRGAKPYSFLTAYSHQDVKGYSFDCNICFRSFSKWEHLFAHECVSKMKNKPAKVNNSSHRRGTRYANVFPSRVHQIFALFLS